MRIDDPWQGTRDGRFVACCFSKRKGFDEVVRRTLRAVGGKCSAAGRALAVLAGALALVAVEVDAIKALQGPSFSRRCWRKPIFFGRCLAIECAPLHPQQPGERQRQ
jgi:hypothetical protein